MTPRSIRRAAERKAKKLARRAENSPILNSSIPASDAIVRDDEYLNEELCLGSPEVAASSSISEARLAANRANAQLSTAPKTEHGKATASLNAVKTALTGRTVLLPSDDAFEYERHI